MSVDQFTIVLTKGTHLISRSSAELVIRAIDDDRRTVEIELDPFGDLDPDRRTVVAVRHVVAVTENVSPIASDSNALALARRRRDRRSL